MTNMFDGLINDNFKNLFNNAIDSLLVKGALTVPCTLRYFGNKTPTLCSNCIIDPVSKMSSNKYNGSGPKRFSDNSICPICHGAGMTTVDSQEILYLAVIFDSKYFLNWSSKTIKIPDGLVQTICLASYLPKLKNANEIIFDTDIGSYGTYVYEKAGDPTPIGFGSNRYITAMWKNK